MITQIEWYLWERSGAFVESMSGFFTCVHCKCVNIWKRAWHMQLSLDSFICSNRLSKSHALPAWKLHSYGGLQCLFFSVVCTIENTQKQCLIWDHQGSLQLCLAQHICPFSLANCMQTLSSVVKKWQCMTFYWPWRCGSRMGALD